MPYSNLQRGRVPSSRVPFLTIIIIFTIIANENGLKMMTLVEGRTWPRIVQQEPHLLLHDHHRKPEIYSTTPATPEQATTPRKDYNTSSPSLVDGPKSEINSALSPILPSPLHLNKGDDGKDAGKNNRNHSSSSSSGYADNYQDFNGSVSLHCNRRRARPSRHHHHNHHEHDSRNSSQSNNNDDYNGHGGSRWWTSPTTATNSTNCLAGPFHLGADVNESVYNALCPLSSSATNGKFSIQGVRCGAAGELFTVCSRNREHGGSGAFTLHECTDEESSLSAETGGCERNLEHGKIKPSSLSSSECPLLQDHDDESTASDDAVLHWALLQQTYTPLELAEESKVEQQQVSSDLQSLAENDDSATTGSTANADGNDNFENLCKSTTSSNSLHSHPHLCNKYIHCSADGSGSFFLQDCGPGTVFNPQKLVCDWPANVPQCSGGDGNELLRRRRAPAIRSAAEIGKVGQSRCDFKGIRADPQFCNKYRLCSAGGVESVHTCGLGTVFNQLSGVCDFADQVDCASRRSDLATYGCDKADKYQAPHPDYCNKFIECQAAVLVVKSCPPGTLYDREAGKCDHAAKVACRKPISLEHDIDVNWKSHERGEFDGLDNNERRQSQVVTIKRKRRSAMLASNWLMRAVRANQLNLACEFNYIAPHPHSCTRFVECEDGKIYVKSCGPGTAFNPILGKCDWPANVREPDAEDCTRYKQCSIRHGYLSRSCPRGQFFYEETRKCVSGSPRQIQECSRREPSTSTTRRPFGAPPPA